MANNVISQRFEALLLDLARLDLLFKRLPARVAQACPLPPVLKGGENEAIESIDVAVSSGARALSLASDCYSDLHIKPGLSQKASRRTVGVLWFAPADGAELQATVASINTAKADIEAYIRANYTTRTTRFQALHEHCPGVMALHLYRRIRCYDAGNVASVRLTWQRKDARWRPDKADVLERIGVERDRAGRDYRVPLQQLWDNVSDTPEHLLRIRRPVKLQPAANIKIGDMLKTVTAPMPIIVIQDAPVTIKMPPSFDDSIRRTRRADYSAPRVLGCFGGVVIEALPG